MCQELFRGEDPELRWGFKLYGMVKLILIVIRRSGNCCSKNLRGARSSSLVGDSGSCCFFICGNVEVFLCCLLLFMLNVGSSVVITICK